MKNKFYDLVILTNHMILSDASGKNKECLKDLIPIIQNSGFDYINEISLGNFLMRGGIILVAIGLKESTPIGCMGLFYDGIHHHLMFQSIIDLYKKTKLAYCLIKEAEDLINESKKTHNCNIQILWNSKLNRSPIVISDNLIYDKVKKIDVYMRRNK